MTGHEVGGRGVVDTYAEYFAVGDPVPVGLLHTAPDACVVVPLEATYESAYRAVPERWREVIEAT